MGNEHIFTPTFTKFATELYSVAKVLDPTRPCIASDGNLPYPVGATNPIVDFYSWQNNAWNEFVGLKQPSKPVITRKALCCCRCCRE